MFRQLFADPGKQITWEVQILCFSSCLVEIGTGWFGFVSSLC